MAGCLILEREASQYKATYLVEQGCSATHALKWRASSSFSIPLPTSCSSPRSPLLPRIRKAQHPIHHLGLRHGLLLRLCCRLGLLLLRLRCLARLPLIFICIAILERPNLR